VTSGPYHFVRHPIYTGMAFALIGSAFAVGDLSWLVFYLALIIMFTCRIHVEEKFMTETFPDQYPEYKKRTKMLIPFIW
jgi:protein-S-isoprenylcysteine O-methyltransferase Ste14